MLSKHNIEEKPGFAVAMLLMSTMAVVTWITQPAVGVKENLGLLSLSMDNLIGNSQLSCILNFAAVTGTAMLTIFLNKRFGLLQGPSILYASVYLVMCGANISMMHSFGAGTLLTLVSVVCLWMLFSCYGKRNATDTVFLLFSILSFCSMIQYAFLLAALAFFVGLSYMRVLRIKETAAMICGMIAPYWIILGFMPECIQSLNFPHITNIFTQMHAFKLAGLLLLAAAGAASILIPGAFNFSKIFATNGQIRGCNGFLNTLGIFVIWFIIFDYKNITTYMGLLNLLAGFQVARFVNWDKHEEAVWIPISIAVVSVALFIFTLYE